MIHLILTACFSFDNQIISVGLAVNWMQVMSVDKYRYYLLGKGGAIKSDDFFEKFQTAPPPIFVKIVLQFLFNGYGRIKVNISKYQLISVNFS